MLRLQPILHILPMSAATLYVDLVSAQLDFFTCGTARGSPWFAPRRGFFYRFRHDSLLWAELLIPILPLAKSCASNPSSAFCQTRVVRGCGLQREAKSREPPAGHHCPA